MNFKLKKISGDASFREFYRLKKRKKISIIIHANKEKFRNLIAYIVINDVLKKNKIKAPELISEHYNNNIIEISDLGNKSFYDLVIKKKNKLKDYKNLIDIILKLQKIKVKKKYTFKKYKLKIGLYNLENLHKESDLFFDWYLKFFLKKKTEKNQKKIKKKRVK